ncbi:hypothetical protein AB205_0096280 [Aquarana catesbeiana]|uniref:Uncharacterized protein n=1 Tax=Aquarana catesbeiana TaxID=8400 RepID=A0A2G9RU21_AQUCT|nr:hypothetical protein AB205_0096280 [Aquarana catesbeiana]
MFHIPISCLKYLYAKYTLFFIHIGEKRLGTSEDTKNTTPPKEGEISTPQPEAVDSEVHELGEIVTTGDVDVVEEETHFILTPNLCASSKCGFYRGDITPSDEGNINTVWTY